MAKKIPLNEIKYLSFEGGGGKGIVYLGTLEALEGHFGKKGTPLINILDTSLYNLEPSQLKQRIKKRNERLLGTEKRERNILGVSGSSAGAITAYMVAMGMTKTQIQTVFTTKRQSTFYPYLPVGPTVPLNIAFKTEDISYFEQLLDDDYSKSYTRIWDQKDEGHVELGRITYKTYNPLLPPLYLQSQPLIRIPVLFGSNYLLRKLGDGNWGKHLYGLLHERGIFSGIRSRGVFGEIMKEFLLKRLNSNQNPLTVTFNDFFIYTGIDLVVTGSNVSTGKPMLFSVYHTRDFPVIEAIAISMNLPGVFRPVYINGVVHNGKTPKYNEAYLGFYADGGITNNLPFRVFNQMEQVHFRGSSPTEPEESGSDSYNILVCSYDYSNVQEYYSDLNWTLSFDLIDNGYKPYKKEEVFEGNNNSFLALLGDLYQTVMFSTSEGQFRTDTELSRRIEVDSTGLKVADFASSDLNNARKDTTEYDFLDRNTGKIINSGELNLGTVKDDLILLAKTTLEDENQYDFR